MFSRVLYLETKLKIMKNLFFIFGNLRRRESVDFSKILLNTDEIEICRLFARLFLGPPLYKAIIRARLRAFEKKLILK